MFKKQLVTTKTFFEFIFIILVLLAALFIRLESQILNPSSPNIIAATNTPVLNNFDGYWYLSLADDLLNHSYEKIDEKRGIPDSPLRPTPPPLLSILLAIFTKILPLSLDWVGIYFPAVFGLTLAIPLFLIGNFIGGKQMALVAVALGIVTQAYMERTSLGYLDTDCLNVTLPLLALFCFMRSSRTNEQHSIQFLITGILFVLVFMWWWTPLVAGILGLAPLFSSALFLKKFKQLRALFIILIFIVVCDYSFSLLFGVSFGIIPDIYKYYSYISKQEIDLYFNVSKIVSEQSLLSCSELVRYTATNFIIFGISVIGLCILILKKWHQTVFLLPITALGLLSVFFGQRFAIFLTPIVALAFGFAFSESLRLLPFKRIVATCGYSLVLFTIWQSAANNTAPLPSLTTQTLEGMFRLRESTPRDAVIWSFWDDGYPIQYWSKRATISDGSIHDGEHTYFNAIPLASNDFRFAANFMTFYITRGISGIHYFANSFNLSEGECSEVLKKIFAGGPESVKNTLSSISANKVSKESSEWIEFLFPENPRPLYLFLNHRLHNYGPWIYYYGTWNISTHAGDKTLPYIPIDGFIPPDQNLPTTTIGPVDYENGSISINSIEGPTYLHQIILTTNSATIKKVYNFPPNSTPSAPSLVSPVKESYDHFGIYGSSGLYELEIAIPAGTTVLKDEKIGDMVVNRLFWRTNDFPTKYFQPVFSNLPHYQVWKITGDKSSTF